MAIFTPVAYSRKYCLLHPWTVIAHKFRDIHCAWLRANKGYCYRDIWEIDNWFLSIVPEMLDEYIKIHTGHPSDMTDEEWVAIINAMAQSFRNADERSTEFTNPYRDEYLKTLEIDYNAGRLLCHADNELDENYHKKEKEKNDFMEKSLDEGMRLFRKHLRKLWD